MNNMDNITVEERAETMRKAHELISNMQRDALNRIPMFMRLNYITNIVAGHKDSEINWDEVNNILSASRHEYDFNLINDIRNLKDLYEARELCIEAPILNTVWQRHKCKDCGDTFSMQFSEVEFYRDKELHIPKRCKNCRDKRRNNSAIRE